MRTRRIILHSTVAVALLAAPLGTAVADTSGTAPGPQFRVNLSGTPQRESSQGKIDGLPLYVTAKTAGGQDTTVGYRADDKGTVEQRSETKPLVATYIDDDANPAYGNDVWVAYSRDDGATWSRHDLSNVADKSSFTLANGSPAYGVVSKPALTLKQNRVMVAWTSNYCAGGDPAYESLTDDPYQVGGRQKSVDYAEQGYPEVGEVPYKCLWAARATLDSSTGDLVWQQPERLTSGTRYAMQITVNSAPGDTGGFGIAWAEDPAGLSPGSGKGPGEGWTGASPHNGTDVWYSYIKASDFDNAASRFSVPVPVSDNGQYSADDPVPLTGATRPALAYSPQGSTVWAAYGYEETKGIGSEGSEESEGEGSTVGAIGKNVIHHAFRFDQPDVRSPGTVMNPQMTDANGKPMFVKDSLGNEVPARENARRVRYIAQPVGQMGPSRTLGALIYRMGVRGESGTADFMMQRIVVPAGDTGNPFRAENIQPPVNVSATTVTGTTKVGGVTRTTSWKQTAANLHDKTSAASRESARAHRGFIKGDFLALGYTWTPDWAATLAGKDVENFYVRRSFDGGATFTTTPSDWGGDGVRSCRYFNDPATGQLRTPVCQNIGPGKFEPAQNISRLRNFNQTVIEPRVAGLPGTIAKSNLSGTTYAEDTQDPSVLWLAWGTGSPKSVGEDDPEDSEVPVPDEGSGKGPLDLYYTVSGDYGDTYLANAPLAKTSAIEAESQLRFTPDGSRMNAVWNDYGYPDGTGTKDVRFARFVPDLLNTPGQARLAGSSFEGLEGSVIRVTVDRTGGRLGNLTAGYATVDGSAVAGRDYQAASGDVTWAKLGPGNEDMRAKVIEIPTIDNKVDGPDKTFSIVVTDASGAKSTATVTIVDDDDTTPPTSRASGPSLTNRVLIPVSYTARDKDSSVSKVTLYVKTPGSSTFRAAGTETTVDGRIGYRSDGTNGVYRFYTRAVDSRGNTEAAPAIADTRVRLDTVKPSTGSAWALPRTLHLRLHRPTYVGFTVGERVDLTVLVKRAGTVVRTITHRDVGPGVVVQAWYGRRDNGNRVRPGTFRVVLKASDEAGNVAIRRVGLTVRR